MSARSVKLSYYCYYLLNSPLFALYGFMPFILRKDIGASAFLISLLFMIKPLVAMFSPYWSHRISHGSHTLKQNIIWATCIGLLPTLFFPLMNNSLLLLGAFSLYFFAERAVIPAWMELLKLSFSKEEHSKLVAQGSLIMFIATALFPLAISPLLDTYSFSWKWIFPLLGLVSLLRIPLLMQLTNLEITSKEESQGHYMMTPWKSSYAILKNRPDFAYYQLIFFFGGLGLMVMHPSLPYIVEENLHLSYTEIALAIALCKGIGYALTTSIWSSKLHKSNIYSYCGFVTLFATLSIALILFSKFLALSIYIAYLVYGVMQAGSHLCWHLGGPIFSPNEDSSSYTSVNVILVGLRGCIGPLLGGFLCATWGSSFALLLASMFCLVGACLGFMGRARVRLSFDKVGENS